MITLMNSDDVCLETVESYMRKMGAPIPRTPQEELEIKQYYRDMLYSDIANRLPRVSAYLMENNDDKAKGLSLALSRHAMDKFFVNIVMQRLATNGFLEDAHLVGALFITIVNNYFETHKSTSKKDEEVEEQNKKNVKETSHLMEAINVLLKDIIVRVKELCPGLNEQIEVPAVAGAIAVNNQSTLDELMNFKKQLTADIFEIYTDPDKIIRNALLMKKNNYLNLNATQKKFIDTLKDFVFKKLDELDMTQIYSYLLSVYQDYKPKTAEYLICITDVSKAQYPNLHEVVAQFK